MQFMGAAFRAAVGIAVLVAGCATAANAQTVSYGFTGAIETWEVPTTGNYRVTVVGAQGGSGEYSQDGGGLGASISADFYFEAGQIYHYAVGEQGHGTTGDFPRGGGGGSFFVDESGIEPIPLMIAGGGGGAAESLGIGRDASTGQNGVTSGILISDPVGPNSATLGYGGLGRNDIAAGGAGFYGDGTTGTAGGKSWANGLVGGGGSSNGAGGFGGGGSGLSDSNNYGGGGGGGYTGGDGGTRGGGGGSYISGDNPQSSISGTGDGSLTIVFLDGAPEGDKAAAIGQFLATRQQLILANGPELSRRISRFNGGFKAGNLGVSGLGYVSTDLPFNLQVGQNRTRFSYDSSSQAAVAAAGLAASTRSSEALSGGQLLGYAPALTPDNATDGVSQSNAVSDLAFWAEGTFANTSDGTLFGIVHTGGDILLTDRILVGIGLSVDSTRQRTSTADVDGLGYMVGPYATFQLSDELYLDLRVAAGQSSNTITMLDETDEFSTTRWLGSAALVGDFQLGIVNVAPEARVSMMDERSDAYTDGSGDLVPSVHVTTGTLELGPRLSLDLTTDGLDWSPYLEGKGIWTFQQQTSGGTPLTEQFDELRARVGAGTSVSIDGSVSGNAGVFYDGIGSGLSAWGATLGISGSL
jgi:hypothetical protein